MSSDYTGTKTAAEPPASAPAPGLAPIVRLPSAGDALTAASVAQAFKTLADYEAWIQKSMLLCPPALPVSASSGYTAVAYTSFGGTVTPSGNGPTVGSTSGTNFVVKIVAGGAVGVATYTISSDGGATFDGTHVTAASLTDFDTGITLAFAGTLTTNGLAQFQSALTPPLVLTDTGSASRSFFSRNGYLMSRVSERIEDWSCIIATNPVAAAELVGTPLRAAWNGTVALFTNTYAAFTNNCWNGPGAEFSIGTTNANALCIGTANALGPDPTNAAANFVSELQWSWSMSAVGANNQLVNAGFYNFASSLPVADAVMFRKDSTDTNWQCVLRAGSADTVVNSGVAPSANQGQRFKIELHGKASPLGTLATAAVALFFIDDQLVAAMTTGMPVNFLGVAFGVQNTALSGGATHNLGPVRWAINNYSNTTPV